MNKTPTANSQAYHMPSMGDAFYAKHNLTPPSNRRTSLLGPVVEVIDKHSCWVKRDNHNTKYIYLAETNSWHAVCFDYGTYKVDIESPGINIMFKP